VSGEKKIGNRGVGEGDTYFLWGMEGFIYDKSPFIPLVKSLSRRIAGGIFRYFIPPLSKNQLIVGNTRKTKCLILEDWK
jgi:hypothetical protein